MGPRLVNWGGPRFRLSLFRTPSRLPPAVGSLLAGIQLEDGRTRRSPRQAFGKRWVLRLFALTEKESRQINCFFRWHLGYLLLVALFFAWMYNTNRFRSHPIFREKFLFLVLAPLSTFVFVIVGPWRRRWAAALRDMRARLEGQVVFCLMAGFVFLFGFLVYSVLIWGLGALGPALAHM